MTSKKRIVLDTNLLISYLIKANSPVGHVVDHVLKHHSILYSEASLLELVRKVSSTKLRRYFTEPEGIQLVLLLEQVAEFVEVKTTVTACRDPKDNIFLALAYDGDADMLLTGDKDLLVLNSFRNIPIIRPTDYAGLNI